MLVFLSSLQAPLFFGLIAAFITTLGLLAVALRADWSARNADFFALTAGGMLLTLTLLHIAPEAFERTHNAAPFLLAGFLGGVLLSQSMRAVTRSRAGDTRSAFSQAITPLLAIAVHSFIDGVIYSVTFAASFEAGAYAAISLILHEFPEGIIAFALVRAAGATNRTAFIWAFFSAAITTPLGVLFAGPFMFTIGEAAIGQLFAISAGLLLYVATGPLMAHARDEAPVRNLLAIGTGVMIAVLIALLPIHAHGGDDHDDHAGLLANTVSVV